MKRRIWKVPVSSSSWCWLLVSALLYMGLLAWYFYALKTQAYPGPFADPLRFFGIVSYALVLLTASYTLRRRFMRSLPGMVQNWLWLHTWLGMITILIALLHENYTFVTHDFCQNIGCLTDTYWAAGALYALILLVVVGVVGRLLDTWLAKVITREASSNGVGIARSVAERLRELEYVVERYCAGKSAAFKYACSLSLAARGRIPRQPVALPAYEHEDWKKIQSVLANYAYLSHSLHRLQSAQRVIRVWRTVHICLASLALVVISYHAIMELLTSVFHILAQSG